MRTISIFFIISRTPLVAYQSDGLRAALHQFVLLSGNRNFFNILINNQTTSEEIYKILNWEFINPNSPREPRPLHLAVQSILYNGGDVEETKNWIIELIDRGANPDLVDAKTGATVANEAQILIDEINHGIHDEAILNNGGSISTVLEGLKLLDIFLNSPAFSIRNIITTYARNFLMISAGTKSLSLKRDVFAGK